MLLKVTEKILEKLNLFHLSEIYGPIKNLSINWLISVLHVAINLRPQIGQ